MAKTAVYVYGEADHPSFDALTIRTYLSSALTRFLGQTGAGIPIDLLKINDPAQTSGRDDEGDEKKKKEKEKIFGRSTCWIRIPSQDLTAVCAALTSWVYDLDPVSFSGYVGMSSTSTTTAAAVAVATRGSNRGARGTGIRGGRGATRAGRSSSDSRDQHQHQQQHQRGAVDEGEGEGSGQKVAWRILAKERWLGQMVLQSGGNGTDPRRCEVVNRDVAGLEGERAVWIP